MAHFKSEITVPWAVPDVFAWHARLGAFVRLTPPWNSRVVSPPSHGLEVGSRATLRLDVPGTFGRLGVRWLAEHVALDPGRSFTDVMASGPLRSWRHHHEFTPTAGGTATTITDSIEFRGPIPGFDRLQERVVTRILAANFAYREQQLADDLAFHATHSDRRMTVVVAGASGLIGTQLCALLSTGGHTVRRLVRRPASGPDEIQWDPTIGRGTAGFLDGADVVIHLGGRTIGGRFTATNKEEMRSSRLDSTRVLAEAVAASASGGAPPAFVCASAIGIYGADRGGELLTEQSSRGSGFLADLCDDWERATSPAAEAGARVVNVRTGIVQSPSGGALAQQLPLFKTGLGGKLGTGKQWLSWISLDDIVGVFAHAALTSTMSGPVNAVAPQPVTGSAYAKMLGAVLRRPAVLPVPPLAPAVLLGREGARELALASQRVDSGSLTESGYEFRQPTLEGALRHVLGRYGTGGAEADGI